MPHRTAKRAISLQVHLAARYGRRAGRRLGVDEFIRRYAAVFRARYNAGRYDTRYPNA